MTFVGTVPLEGEHCNPAGVQSAKIRAKKELHMFEEQNRTANDHIAISYTPAGFNNFKFTSKVHKCSFTI